ncbi:P2Y purinoceptor 1 [Latimeria chalumnae]|uniref:P2Y purinoceptor 1 n=1 Tax=Latimeria chalumnae TaxID=7897 RepID=UPI0003C15D0A|nr:PREDICTED: P2Y purinoceptor 11 [Latimeria chalumnae]|eukprot:XP_006005946.1 PREDICTED: P2Y purinoceptor 11 [Latimeria chalumnae]
MCNYNASNVSFASFQKDFLPPVFGIEFLLALLGNSLAMWLLYTREKTWHTGIIYAFNLAVNDLLYVLSLPLLMVYYLNNKDWIFGNVVCKLERFLFTCNFYGSIFFVTCISFNRYIGIVHPFFSHGKVHPKHAKMVSLAVWVLIFTSSTPVLFFSTTDVTKEQKNKTECLGSSANDMLYTYFPYSLSMAVLGCGLPFLITLASYVAIFWTVFKNETISMLEKKKIAYMITIVVILYAVSFLPYSILRNINLYRRMKCFLPESSLDIHKAYQVTKGLVTLNMCIHPLLYASVATSIRSICRRTEKSEATVTEQIGIQTARPGDAHLHLGREN